MQIHEVFGLAATARAMAKDPKSLVDPVRFGQAKQAGYAASAERSAQKLQAKGYGAAATAAPPNQLLAQVRASQPVQQLVNTWSSQWPAIAAKIPAAPTPVPAAPAAAPAAQEPMIFGRDRLDPKDPADARMIAQLRAQGKINEQSSAVDADTYKAAFVAWADSVVEKTARLPGALAQVKKQPEWAQQFSAAADRVASTANNAEENKQAVEQYLILAVAAARDANQSAPADRPAAPTNLNDPTADALAKTIGLDAAGIAKLNAFMRRQGETVNPQGTGSKSLDALLRAAKILK
jgi:hypothetical protein